MTEPYAIGKIWQTPIENGQVGKPRLIPWNQAARQSKPGGTNRWVNRGQLFKVPDEQVARMQEALPPVVRRTPKERYRATLNRVALDALNTYRVTGRIAWPKSAWDELKVLAWKTGDPHLTDLGGEDQLRRQIEALTRHVVETGEMQQKENDQRKSVLDWAGH